VKTLKDATLRKGPSPANAASFTAVIFDMGDVFFDATAWRKSLTRQLQSLGVAVEYAELCRRWEAKLVAVYLGRRKYWDAFGEFLADFGLTQKDIDDTTAFARRKATEVEKRTLFDGVAETLAGLKARGLKLAVLSDTESGEAAVRRRLAELGIERYFDAVVASVDIGHVKPEAEAFAAALSRLNVAASEAMFVGHDADELEGAMRCGLTAVAYNYEAAAPADRHISHFSELLRFPTR
jgi:putative hydrolase of the HAD superfamily